MNGSVSYIYEPYRLDWGQVMAFAADYMQAKMQWERLRKVNAYADSRSFEFRNYQMAEMSLWGIACAIGIPMYVLVHAARYERKYYEHCGLGLGLDYQRLIVGLDANRREYADE